MAREMNKQEQEQFVSNLADRLKAHLVGEIRNGQVPENWTGWELRQWFSDLADEQVAFLDMGKERRKEYENDRLINNI